MGTGGSGTGGFPLTGGLESVLDDFEDGNATIKLVDGRFGNWNAYTDMTVADTAMMPGPNQAFFTTPRPEDGDNEALRVTATGFTSWGIGMFCSFDDTGVDPDPPLVPYDLVARGYDAVRLWAKRESMDVSSELILRIADAASTKDSEGGDCPEATCALDHASATVILGTEWEEHTILLSDFTRGSTPDPIDFSASFQFHLTASGTAIDFWVDDIRFVDLETQP